jgi:hypothetical protein
LVPATGEEFIYDEAKLQWIGTKTGQAIIPPVLCPQPEGPARTPPSRQPKAKEKIEPFRLPPPRPKLPSN